MASWNSLSLDVTYQIFGWIAFVAWSISFYPQAILNFRRKSVVGLNFDFLVLNITKHSSYLIYNAALFFSPATRRQYREKYGWDEDLLFWLGSFLIFSFGWACLDKFLIYYCIL
ncbi:cystinosin homolog isoform X2 [Curcuma longa]|uniref:cystinosin homolog isoform X2 n=1 Tax=Curcuma longa TaxID=136217 RepID=UPI003D9E0494